MWWELETFSWEDTYIKHFASNHRSVNMHRLEPLLWIICWIKMLFSLECKITSLYAVHCSVSGKKVILCRLLCTSIALFLCTVRAWHSLLRGRGWRKNYPVNWSSRLFSQMPGKVLLIIMSCFFQSVLHSVDQQHNLFW